MAGSQLTQLKSALTNAGLGRKSFSKKEKKAFKKGGARESDRAKTLQKLEDIKRGLNKFDHTETKLKHDVGGRQLKGVTGNPSMAKQAGLEKRKAQLLTEHQSRDHRGTFQDRRFGEADPNMTLEDRMLERYTRERQRGQGKKGLFNLEEGDELDDMDEGNALGGLTHGGRSVLDLPGDDFMLQGLDDPDDEEKHIDRRTVQRNHFGGFQEKPEDDEEELPERKKSKQEVMAEVMAKSKSYKAERQHQNDLDADLRDELDGDINDLRALLNEAPAERVGFKRQPVSDKDDAEYAQFVKTLAFEARAKPKDRTKTEDELAIEEKERLEKAEAKRLRRMRGEESEDEDSRGKKRKVDDRREGDDLGDDFVDEDEEDLLGPGLTREGLEKMGAAKAAELEEEEEDEDDEDEDEDEDEDDEDEDEGDEEEDSEEEDDDEDLPSDMEDLDEAPDLDSADEEETTLVKKRKRSKATKTTEIPYTFICPATIDELEDTMEPLDDSAIPTVVQRIRAIHHPSLAQGNKEKLQEFFGVLLDYTLVLASRPVPAFSAISSLVPHLIALVKMNPITAAGHFIGKITLMQKNLSRGLARGATRLDSKTYPGAPELVIFRLVGSIWSTSDFSHPVVAPAVLLMGQYLSHGRIRTTSDLGSGLMICSLLVQFESNSKRFLPETINFLAGSIVALLPRRKDSQASAHFPDLVAPAAAAGLHITSANVPAEVADLAALLSSDNEQSKSDLLSTSLRLIETTAALYSSSNAFIEAFQPMLLVLQSSKTTKLSDVLKQRLASTTKTLSRMLNLAITSRQPLALQSHKPVPIASHAPKFEEGYQPGKRYDPDAERNAASKLKAQYKQERKGAIRELRKDNRFLAGEKAKDQAEKDREYTAKMRRAEGSITVERAEEKEMEREKAREKRRAGRG